MGISSSDKLSKYHQQLKCKYKSLSLSSPDEVLECKSSEYVNLYLTKFEEKSKTQKQNLVSGYLNSLLKNPMHETERAISGSKSLC